MHNLRKKCLADIISCIHLHVYSMVLPALCLVVLQIRSGQMCPHTGTFSGRSPVPPMYICAALLQCCSTCISLQSCFCPCMMHCPMALQPMDLPMHSCIHLQTHSCAIFLCMYTPILPGHPKSTYKHELSFALFVVSLLLPRKAEAVSSSA